MPQMTKGGKFIFGKSEILEDGTVQIPLQAMEEYHITDQSISVYRKQDHRWILCHTKRAAIPIKTWAYFERDSRSALLYF